MQEQFAENVSVSHSASVGLRQFAFKIENAVADRIVPLGGHVVCVPYRAARPRGPHYGDVLLLCKTKTSGLDEWIVARATYCADRWELHFESSDPRWEHETIIPSSDWTRDLNDECVIDVVGFVQGVVTEVQSVHANCSYPMSVMEWLSIHPTIADVGLVAATVATMALLIAKLPAVVGASGPIIYALMCAATSWFGGTVRSTIINASSVASSTFFFFDPVYSFYFESVMDANYMLDNCVLGVLATGMAVAVRAFLPYRQWFASGKRLLTR
jgi:hypothetical protein